jgi:hypothetical protein
MLKRKLVLPALSLLAVATAATIVAIAGPASAHKAPHRVRSGTARQASGAAAVLRAFSVVRKSVTKGGGSLPSSVAHAASTASSQASQLQAGLTTQVKVSDPYPVSVSPENGQICLFQQGVVGPGVGSSFCASYEEALSGKFIGLSGIYPSGTESVVIGLAPNGNSSVLATDANGSTRAVDVSENVYEIVGKAPQTITLHDAEGQTETFPVPGA